MQIAEMFVSYRKLGSRKTRNNVRL